MLRSWLSAGLVPRSACTGPFAAAIALLASEVAAPTALEATSGPGKLVASALPPSCLMRFSRPRDCAFVSFRCSRRRFFNVSFWAMPIWACSTVSSCFSLPYASFRYCTSFSSRAVCSAMET